MNQTGPNGGSDKGQGSRGPGRIRNVNGANRGTPGADSYPVLRATCWLGGVTVIV